MSASTHASAARVNRNGVQTNLRLPEDLRVRLIAEATKNGRSFASEIVHRLFESLGDMEHGSMAAETDLVDFKMRLPSELHAALKTLAAQEKRSISAQIVHIVEEFLRESAAAAALKGGSQ